MIEKTVTTREVNSQITRLIENQKEFGHELDLHEEVEGQYQIFTKSGKLLYSAKFKEYDIWLIQYQGGLFIDSSC